VPYRRVPELYRDAALFVSASRTGSVDKVVLEAMASARPVLTCNPACAALWRGLGRAGEELCFPSGDAPALARRAAALLDQDRERSALLGRELRSIVARDHEVDALMARLVRSMEELA
jgi:glycosyltransferase involved in cell wall biosynthesis